MSFTSQGELKYYYHIQMINPNLLHGSRLHGYHWNYCLSCSVVDLIIVISRSQNELICSFLDLDSMIHVWAHVAIFIFT